MTQKYLLMPGCFQCHNILNIHILAIMVFFSEALAGNNIDVFEEYLDNDSYRTLVHAGMDAKRFQKFTEELQNARFDEILDASEDISEEEFKQKLEAPLNAFGGE